MRKAPLGSIFGAAALILKDAWLASLESMLLLSALAYRVAFAFRTTLPPDVCQVLLSVDHAKDAPLVVVESVTTCESTTAVVFPFGVMVGLVAATRNIALLTALVSSPSTYTLEYNVTFESKKIGAL